MHKESKADRFPTPEQLDQLPTRPRGEKPAIADPQSLSYRRNKNAPVRKSRGIFMGQKQSLWKRACPRWS
jgi:hypothetical protein